MKTNDSNYIQQHLANERTYLAWIRTSLAIIGIGFLIMHIHFSLDYKLSVIANFVAESIGIVSVFIGMFSIIISTISYLKKKKQINEQTFLPVSKIIILTSILVMILVTLFFLYFVIY